MTYTEEIESKVLHLLNSTFLDHSVTNDKYGFYLSKDGHRVSIQIDGSCYSYSDCTKAPLSHQRRVLTQVLDLLSDAARPDPVSAALAKLKPHFRDIAVCESSGHGKDDIHLCRGNVKLYWAGLGYSCDVRFGLISSQLKALSEALDILNGEDYHEVKRVEV